MEGLPPKVRMAASHTKDHLHRPPADNLAWVMLYLYNSYEGSHLARYSLWRYKVFYFMSKILLELMWQLEFVSSLELTPFVMLLQHVAYHVHPGLHMVQCTESLIAGSCIAIQSKHWMTCVLSVLLFRPTK